MTNNPDDLNIWLAFISQLDQPVSNVKKKKKQKLEHIDLSFRHPIEILSSEAWENFTNQVDELNYKRHEYASYQPSNAIKAKIEMPPLTAPNNFFYLPLSVKEEQELNRSDKKQLIKKKNYKLQNIDLHGYTLPEAYEKLKNTFVHSSHMKIRILHVITGKGTRTPTEERPTLRAIFSSWMQESYFSSKIDKIRKAPKEYGGDGAFLVFLKKN